MIVYEFSYGDHQMSEVNFEELLSLREAGDIMGVSWGTVLTLINDGRLRGIRVSPRRWGIAPSDLRKYMDSCATQPSEQ